MNKVAFFDFCETLVNFQTADAFIDFVRENNKNLYMKFFDLFLRAMVRSKIIPLFNRFFKHRSISKELKLLQIKGMNYETLNRLALRFYNERIRPNLINKVITEMKKLSYDHDICIVSAGYSVYLKYFAEEYKIKDLISTEIAFDHKKSICLGTIQGKDCISFEKVSKVKQLYKSTSVDYQNSISFSDSLSDLPLLQLTGKAVVVSKNREKDWPKLYGFSEIIWS